MESKRARICSINFSQQRLNGGNHSKFSQKSSNIDPYYISNLILNIREDTQDREPVYKS